MILPWWIPSYRKVSRASTMRICSHSSGMMYDSVSYASKSAFASMISENRIGMLNVIRRDMSVNSIVLSGRLGKNVELRSTTGGKSVASFSIAVDDGWGEKKSTIWVNIEVWDKTAEAVSKLVTAGKRVAVVGSLKEDVWQDKNGDKKSRFKVLASRVDIIDFPEKESEGEDQQF